MTGGARWLQKPRSRSGSRSSRWSASGGTTAEAADPREQQTWPRMATPSGNSRGFRKRVLQAGAVSSGAPPAQVQALLTSRDRRWFSSLRPNVSRRPRLPRTRRSLSRAPIRTNSMSGLANSIKTVGVIKNLSDEQLLETVQRQTFRYFWHYAHPNSGMARERSNTVKADFYWDFINEANDEPNLSKGTFGPEACAVGGTGFGILATIVAVERNWISREAALDRLIQIVDFLMQSRLLSWDLSPLHQRRHRQDHCVRPVGRRRRRG